MVLPTRNEGALIGRKVAALPDYVDHIVVVDDASADDTAERASVAALGRPDFSLVVHDARKGRRAALASGVQRASQGRPDLIVTTGDRRAEPLELADLLDALLASDRTRLRAAGGTTAIRREALEDRRRRGLRGLWSDYVLRHRVRKAGPATEIA